MPDTKSSPAILFVGGFLGAGKTTLIARAAAWLHARGRRVAILTNDQAAGLVDTHVLAATGVRVGEVAGGCFCCRYEDLAARRAEIADADVVLAEPVGSCTDLAATVLRPWLRDHGDRVLPLSVLVSPARLGQALNPRTPGTLPFESAYILHKQLEEADVIVLSKCASVSARTLEHDLARLANAFHSQRILALDAVTGEGVDEWIETVFGAGGRGREVATGGGRGIDVDYDLYAAGEAGLGWLNARVSLELDERASGSRLAHWLLEEVRQRLERLKAELVHGKLVLVSNGALVRANLVDTLSVPKVEGEILGPAQVELVFNARAVIGPAKLRAEFLGALWRVGKQASPILLELTGFAPARPVPKHRIAAAKVDPEAPQFTVLPVESLPSRRKIMFAGGAGIAALLFDPARPLGAFAGPFTSSGASESLVPADKKLDPEWVRSLTARGVPTTYHSGRGELEWIGMPIGGICAGQLYLGGDGKLWHWDIFNLPQAEGWSNTSGLLYAKPAKPSAPLEQGFALKIGERVWTLDRKGFADIEFQGQYPIATVRYSDPACPVKVELEAFSPFVPLDPDDSGLPATIFEFRVTNAAAEAIDFELAGWLENVVCRSNGTDELGSRRNVVARTEHATVLTSGVQAAPEEPLRTDPREDVVVEDFEGTDYGAWTASGTAFGTKPRQKSQMPDYQGDLLAHGAGLVNSHETRHGESIAAGDAHTGTLRSPEIELARDFLNFRIGGGRHPGTTCLNLLVDGRVVRTATGLDSNAMRRESFDVRAFSGRKAVIEIVDMESGSWGNVGIDELVLSDAPAAKRPNLVDGPDHGTLALGLLGPLQASASSTRVSFADLPRSAFGLEPTAGVAHARFGETLVGAHVRRARLEPGATVTVTFVLAWHFPSPNRRGLKFLDGIETKRHAYAARFADAPAVVAYVVQNFDRLAALTRRWKKAYYDESTLPHWLLERAFANVSIAATSTCYRFDDGRFYGNEGTYCCPGTCTHVWQYAQGLARIFPSLERGLRDEIDYGASFHDDTGAIDYRGEAGRSVAHDGQAGTILRAWREHTLAPDATFLNKRWPRIKKSIELLIRADANEDGLLEGAQYNTLDASWYGPMGWLSSLYVAALRAGEKMAGEVGDVEFAGRCYAIAERGSKNLVERLFDGEYFVHRTDPEHPEANSTNDGCHIDQVMGQSMAHQYGLARVVPEKEAQSALEALWKYSFAPDVGVYRSGMKAIQGGRWYALPGEAGLLMCTFPKGGAERATGKGGEAWAAGYFNECMTGFEYQVATHMLWAGMLTEGLAVTRAIHDRYHAAKRNPWNEVECSNHYARALASYGVYLAALGFEYHGPSGMIGFAPRIRPEDFSAAFTCAEGFGQYTQVRSAEKLSALIEIHHGRLRVKAILLEIDERTPAKRILLSDEKSALAISTQRSKNRVLVTLASALVLEAGRALSIEIT